RVVEGDPDLCLQVGSARRLGPSAAPPASAAAAEQPTEQIPEVPEILDVEPLYADALPAGAGEATAGEAADARGRHLADLVVGGALLLVAKHVVRRGDLLEPLLRVAAPAVTIRVVLLRELPVGLLDLRGRRVLGDAEDLVVVLLEP